MIARAAMHTTVATALFAAAACAQSIEFERVETTTRSRSLEVREYDGAILRANGSRLERVRGSETIELGNTEAVGTGPIVELVTQPHGATFMAAARGVFVVSPEVDVLDAIHRADGGPRGAPIGIALSRDGRTLFIATKDEVGCVDTVQFFGRVFPRETLPGGTIVDVAIEANRIVVVTDSGSYRLREAPPPRLDVDSVDGKAWVSGARFSCPERSSRVDVTTDDGCTVRYRRRGHHLWRPYDGTLRGLEPGSQSYEFVALDAALRRSATRRVDFDVAYPKAFEKRILLPLALGWLLLLGALFAFAARRGALGRHAAAKAALSTLVAFFVSIQLLTGVIPHARSWPFVGFTMYTQKFVERDLIFETKFYGIEADGSRRLIRPVDAGRTMDGKWTPALPLVYDPEVEARRFLEDYNRNTGSSLTAVQIVEFRRRLTHRGPIPVAPILWVHWQPR